MVGRKGRDYFRRRKLTIGHELRRRRPATPR